MDRCETGSAVHFTFPHNGIACPSLQDWISILDCVPEIIFGCKLRTRVIVGVKVDHSLPMSRRVVGWLGCTLLDLLLQDRHDQQGSNCGSNQNSQYADSACNRE